MPRPREFDTAEAVDTALVMFWRRGYAATSSRDLCTGTGLGRGSLYNAFTSKRDLYLRALARYYELGTARAVAILEGTGTIHERIRELMTAVIDTDLADPDRKGCLAINAAIEMANQDPEVKTAVRQHFERVEGALRDAVERAVLVGELSGGRAPAVTARLVLSSYYGLRVLARATDDREALLDVVTGTLDALS
jgi:TetR/AcrR family transcriptional repressor of nem operon